VVTKGVVVLVVGRI